MEWPKKVRRQSPRRCTISSQRTYVELESERRLYNQLNEAEKAVIRLALPRGSISREVVLENLAEKFTKASLKQAFSQLCEENRLFRIGNQSEHIIIERDLFS